MLQQQPNIDGYNTFQRQKGPPGGAGTATLGTIQDIQTVDR